MPGAITDDICANSKVLAEDIAARKYGRSKNLDESAATDGRCGVCAPRFLEVPRNHFSSGVHRAVPKFIALLVAAVSIGLANRVDAECVDCCGRCFTNATCWRTLRVVNPEAITDEYAAIYKHMEGDNQHPPVTGRYDNWYGNWYGHFNTGDNINEWWYHYLDEGRYYHLSIARYKLLGEKGRRWGGIHYTKSFVGTSVWAGRPTSGRSWARLVPYRLYRYIDKGVRSINHSGYPPRDIYIWYGGPLPLSNNVIWNCCFSTGDNIDVWKYYYLHEWRYEHLSETRYKLLGGRWAYQSDYLRYRDPYTYGLPFPYYPEVRFQANTLCYAESAIPEPVTIGFLGLGGLGLLISRGKRGG